MNKKILLPTIALLILSTMMAVPVNAKTIEPYESHIEAWLIDPGKVWTTEDGVLHVKNSYWRGTEEGTLGTGTFEEWFYHLSLDLTTGEGAFNVKWKIVIPEKGSIEGTARGIITLGYILSGTFVGTHGTGAFEGVKKMGSIEVFLVDPTYKIVEASGITIYP